MVWKAIMEDSYLYDAWGESVRSKVARSTRGRDAHRQADLHGSIPGTDPRQLLEQLLWPAPTWHPVIFVVPSSDTIHGKGHTQTRHGSYELTLINQKHYTETRTCIGWKFSWIAREKRTRSMSIENVRFDLALANSTPYSVFTVWLLPFAVGNALTFTDATSLVFTIRLTLTHARYNTSDKVESRPRAVLPSLSLSFPPHGRFAGSRPLASPLCLSRTKEFFLCFSFLRKKKRRSCPYSPRSRK